MGGACTRQPLFLPKMRSKQGKLWGLISCAVLAFLLLTLFIEELPVRRVTSLSAAHVTLSPRLPLPYPFLAYPISYAPLTRLDIQRTRTGRAGRGGGGVPYLLVSRVLGPAGAVHP